jgi:hypothetical protein
MPKVVVQPDDPLSEMSRDRSVREIFFVCLNGREKLVVYVRKGQDIEVEP